MGDLISLDDHRHGATHPVVGGARFARATFYFDLGRPETYFAAETVEKLFPAVRWVPVNGSGVGAHAASPAAMEAAEARAVVLGVPLVWPHPYPTDVAPAMRAAAVACELGRGAPFVLAASRLAYCGGFDLCDPEVLAEAAAAAGLPLDVCLAAAGDHARDAVLDDTAQRLLALGVRELPVMRVGRVLFDGEARLPEALAAATAQTASRQPATA
jgi:2-hydroxychromene-2-carboxylate isomerase